MTIEQLEIPSSRQNRTIREHSLNFPDLAPTNNAAKAGRKLLDLLNGKQP